MATDTRGLRYRQPLLQQPRYRFMAKVMEPQIIDASIYNLGFVYLFKAADMIRHPLRALFVVSVFVYDETVLEGQYIDAQVLLSFAISMVGGAAILAVGFCSGQSAIERFPMYVLNFLKEASENSTNHIRTFKTYPMRVWANCVIKGCIRRKVLHDGVDIVRVKSVTYGIY